MPMSLPRPRASALLAACLFAAPAAYAASPPMLPFSQVRAGMKGTGKTVFHGETIETFDVEIVGLLPNIGPGQDLILGRCTGGPLGQTGILAGMSGSPVTIDGKLVGAISYSWGFSKDAIAGITPIEEMIAVGAREGSTLHKARPSGAMPWRDALRHLRSPSELGRFFTSRLSSLAARPAAASATIPLSVSGIDASGLARIAPDLARAGFMALPSGSGGAGAASATAPMEPGSAVGVQLVRGDVDMTATGTVTWVDGDALYAFGHPLYGLGDIDMPLTAARVETLLPSLEQSAKIAIPLNQAGAFKQDRGSGVFGRLGANPAMVPVRLQMTDGSGLRRTYSFDLVDDPLLSPLLLYTAINGVLGTIARTFGSATVRLREGSVIKVDGATDVRLDNLFAGDGATSDASGLSAFLLYLVMNNEWSTPRVSGINLILDYDREPRIATVRRVTLDRYRVKAGTSVIARVLVAPYRGPDREFIREIEIPEETAPGPLTLQFGDAAAMNRVDDADGPVVPRNLAQLVTLVNRLRRNDRVYILASRADNGVFLGGARLPNLPPSITSILTRPRSFGNYTFVPERGVLESDIPAEGAVEGYVRLSVEVLSP
jgi:hypothetical protein